jgi:hypothetical protein
MKGKNMPERKAQRKSTVGSKNHKLICMAEKKERIVIRNTIRKVM